MAGITIISAVAGGYGIEEPPQPGEDVNPIYQRIAYLYSLNTTVNVNVVATGGNLDAITDNRMIAGAMEQRTAADGGFASAANTPNISSILGGTYDRLNTTVSSSLPALPADTDLHRYPILLQGYGRRNSIYEFTRLYRLFYSADNRKHYEWNRVCCSRRCVSYICIE